MSKKIPKFRQFNVMRKLPTITDPIYNEVGTYSSLDQFFLKYINDKRDLPFIHLLLKLTFINLPVALLLFTSLLSGWHWWFIAFIYAGLVIYFVGPFTLMLHNTSHRRLFKKKYGYLNQYIPWVIGPFMGQSPETYFSHHIGMHHVENNLEGDKSTTMPYQRDSFIDFVKYGGGFLLIGVWELAEYFRKKRFMKLYKMVMRGEFSFIFLIVILAFVHLQAALWVFITCTIIVRLSMMAGNWGQHAFIDAASPENNYRNSLTCINSAYNRNCFNDGYHIGHHLNPSMHWTDMPKEFIRNKMKYADERAIIYEGLDFHMVWLFLMLKRYDKLAAHFVDIDNRYQSDDEIIQLLKERTKKIRA